MFKQKTKSILSLVPALLFVVLVIYLLISDPNMVGPF